MDVTIDQLVTMMMEFSNRLDKAQRELQTSLNDEAEKEYAYRLARSVAWTRAGEGTAAQKEARVDAECAEARRDRDKATGAAKSALEMVRNCRQQLSMLQSAGNSLREEAALARVGVEPHIAVAERLGR